MRQKSICPGCGMQSQKQGRLRSGGVSDTGNRPATVSGYDCTSRIDSLRQQVVTGAMKILYGHLPDTMRKQAFGHCVHIPAHRSAGRHPLPRFIRRSRIAPTAGAALDIGHDQHVRITGHNNLAASIKRRWLGTMHDCHCLTMSSGCVRFVGLPQPHGCRALDIARMRSSTGG